MTRPLRVLHVVGGLERGGIELWLMRLLRRLTPECARFDFAVHAVDVGSYEAEARARGATLWRLPARQSVGRYVWSLVRIMRKGNYDVVHSHVHYFSGLVALAARIAGVPQRIVHCHTDTTVTDRKASPMYRAYAAVMRKLIALYATTGVACSREAAALLFGKDWPMDSRWKVLYCGIELQEIVDAPSRIEARKRLGLDEATLVFGHVGRLRPVKNQMFLLEVTRLVGNHRPVCLVVAGDGPERTPLERRAHDLGIGDRVRFLGARDDVPSVLRAMDAFLLPSYHEGLPVSLLEAQACGVPCLVSAAVTAEAAAIPELVQFAPLSVGPRRWGEMAESLASHRPSYADALARFRQSPFTVERSLMGLLAIYGAQAGVEVL